MPKSFMTNPLTGSSVGAGTDTTNSVVSSTSATTSTPRGVTNPNVQIKNNFTHDNINNVVSASDEYTLNFLPNILDNYDAYTYHWKLFITSTENSRNGTVLNSANQVIIAESGVTDLTIDKVEMHGIAVPSVEAGTGTQTIIKFEIVEPSGAGLLDQLYYESLALGIGNWLVMPCYLELQFRGRDPITGSSVINGSSGGIGTLRWIWPIKLTNSKANVTNVGTRYDFEAILYDELAQSNSSFVVQHNVTLRELTKFGKAMSDLQDKLNADQYEKLIDNYSIPDTYRIVVDPNLDIDLVNPDNKKNTSRGSDYVDLSKKTATFSSGTSIDKIVDSLLGSTKYFQEKLQDSATPSSEPNPTSKETNQMKKMWRIVTETKPIAYDYLRQNNAVEITIYIVEYDLGAVDATPAQTGQTPDSIPASKKRMVEYVKKKILNKRYDYIFTGLNDQVINLDLNLNYSFAAALARFGGNYYDSAIRDKGISQKDMDQYTRVTNQLRETLQWINNAPAGADVNAKIQQTQNSINAAKLPTDIQARYTTLLNNAKPATRTNFTKQIIAGGGLNTNGTTSPASSLSQASQYATQLAQPVNGLTFVSDVNINSQTAQNAQAAIASLGAGKLRPIPYVETNQEKNLATGIDPNSDPGRSRTSSVFSTALYSTLDASLQSIKLTIKGDPYWLFPRGINAYQTALQYKSNMADADAIAIIKGSQLTNLASAEYSVNMFGTDNFIIIRFRTPRIYNEVTGLNDPNPINDPYTEVETFSGVYKVITVISKCEMGKFTQELQCILDPVINLSEILHDIEQASQKTQPVINFVPTTTVDAILPTSVSTQRLQTNNLAPGQTTSLPTVPTNNIGPKKPYMSNIPDDANLTPAQATAQALAGKGIV